MKRYRTLMASVPDRDYPVVELFWDDNYWVEIRDEVDDEELMVQFYPHFEKDFWEIPLEQALEALQAAKSRMLEQ